MGNSDYHDMLTDYLASQQQMCSMELAVAGLLVTSQNSRRFLPYVNVLVTISSVGHCVVVYNVRHNDRRF
jgi:hypothetical protein